MLWLLIPLILTTVLFFTGFRKAALAVLFAAVVAAVWLYAENERVRQLGLESISAAEIALENVTVRRTFDASYEVAGRIVNRSKRLRVDGISIEVKLRDCLREGAADCTEIGDATAHVSVTVAPEDARPFVGTLYYGKGAAQPKGTLGWTYKLVGVRTRPQ